ncbi:MAG: hypothetical protein NXI30_05825 [bacterium]|nr:hypothetical protein [bacterium]
MFLRSRDIVRAGNASGLAVAFLLVASVAEARLESLHWTHPRTDATAFDVRVQPLAGGAAQVTSLGLPTPDGQGVFAAGVEVGDGDVSISMRAYGPGGSVSDWSNAQVRLGDGTPPPPLPPDPPAPEDPTVEPGSGTEIPPTAGAAARFDWDTDSSGTVVPGWVDTDADFSLDVDDALFRLVWNSGNRMLTTSSTASDIHSHAVAAGNIRSNFEVRGRMAIDHPDAEIGITTYSQYPSSDAYYRIGRAAGESFRFVGRPGVACTSADSGVVPAAGDWLRFEIDVVDEVSHNRIRAKVWRFGESEPSAPQIECVDASANRPRQGTIGVWAGGPGSKYWDDLEIFQGVSSGGGSPAEAPLPPLLLQIERFDP